MSRLFYPNNICRQPVNARETVIDHTAHAALASTTSKTCRIVCRIRVAFHFALHTAIQDAGFVAQLMD